MAVKKPGPGGHSEDYGGGAETEAMDQYRARTDPEGPGPITDEQLLDMANHVLSYYGPRAAKIIGMPTDTSFDIQIGDPKKMVAPDGSVYPAWTQGQTIVLNPEYFKDANNVTDLGRVISHEATHALLDGEPYGPQGTRAYALTEGLADYVAKKLGFSGADEPGKPGPLQGYRGTARFLKWLEGQDEGTVQSIAAAHLSGDDKQFQELTGVGLQKLVKDFELGQDYGDRIRSEDPVPEAGAPKTGPNQRIYAAPVFLQGEGLDQKPKGEASRLNEATPAVPPEEAPLAPEAGMDMPEDTSAPEGVQLQPPSQMALSNAGLDDDLKFLLGDTTRPQEPVRQGLRLTANYTNRVDPEVYAILPHLIVAAKDPEAPAQLKMLVQLLAHHVGRSGD